MTTLWHPRNVSPKMHRTCTRNSPNSPLAFASFGPNASIPKIKISETAEKTTIPHLKNLYRIYENDTGKAMADYITMADETVDVTDGITLFDPVETWKKRTFTNVRAERLNRPIYVNGKRVYENPPLRDIRDFCAAQVATLWDEVTRFENPHRYYVDLSQKLWDERQRLLTEFGR